MTFFRIALAVFVIGNISVFTAFMRISSQPWEAALVFFGYILTNLPIVVSMYAASEIDKSLKGHWLNWLNLLIPVVVGTVGLVIYSKLALYPTAHPAIFFYGPLFATMVWFMLFAILVNVYVLTPTNKLGASTRHEERL